MPGGHYIALSGMRTRLDELDRLAADIANAGTAGYKAERTSHQEALRPVFDSALQSAIDVTTGGRRLDVRAGAIGTTGRDLDIAIEGPGFLTVQTPGGVRYTRNGHLTKDPDGVLVTDDGSPVLGTSGPITLGPGKVAIDADGTVRTGATVAGKLAMVEFDDATQLVREGSSLLRSDGVNPKTAERSALRAGSLEQANVSVVERVAELTSVTRNFQALQKALSVLMNDIDGRAIDHLGRK
jgi:flagellar basal-body rod protein FlgF